MCVFCMFFLLTYTHWKHPPAAFHLFGDISCAIYECLKDQPDKLINLCSC